MLGYFTVWARNLPNNSGLAPVQVFENLSTVLIAYALSFRHNEETRFLYPPFSTWIMLYIHIFCITALQQMKIVKYTTSFDNFDEIMSGVL